MTEAHTSDGEPRPNAPTGREQLKSIVERGERIQDEIEQLGDDFKELMQEAKSAGYDPAAIKKVLKRRNETAEQKAKREAAEAMFDLYLSNLSMLD